MFLIGGIWGPHPSVMLLFEMSVVAEKRGGLCLPGTRRNSSTSSPASVCAPVRGCSLSTGPWIIFWRDKFSLPSTPSPVPHPFSTLASLKIDFQSPHKRLLHGLRSFLCSGGKSLSRAHKGFSCTIFLGPRCLPHDL